MTGITNIADSIDKMIEAENDPHSHTERNPHRFHPSQIAHCKRQCYLRKLGLIDNSDYRGSMHVGTILHEWIEVHAVPHIADALDVDEDDVYTEHEIEHEVGDVTFVGTADLWIPSEEIVVDWKTKGGWYNFEPENDRHLDQIHVYAGSLDAAKFGIVYLNKKDLEARTYPESGDTFGEYDPERFGAVLDRARDVMEAIEDYGIAEDEDEVPFEKCYEDSGDPCYFCDSEELDFSE